MDVFEDMERKQLNTPRGKVFYWVSHCQSPVTLVFLHGLFTDHNVFSDQVPYFLGKYNLLCWDAPTHGLSRPYSVHTFTYDAVDLRQILKQEMLSSPLLIGQGIGGITAQVFLRNDPAMGLLALGTFPFSPELYSRWDELWLRQPQWICPLCSRPLLVRILRRFLSGTHVSARFLDTSLQKYKWQELCRILTFGTYGIVKEHRDISHSCPIRLMAGEKDPVPTLVSHSQSWADRDQLSLTLLPDTGHLISLEQPDALNQEIEDFMNSLLN